MKTKTLDEVIEDFEKACDLERRCENCSGCLGQENGCPYDGAESVPDALYYLKMYRSDKLQWEADKKAYEDERQKAIHATKKARERYIALAKDTKDELAVLRDFWAEQQANPALSWEELKQMEGKPVWVELLKGKWKGWDVIGGFDNDEFGGAMVTVRGDDYYIDDLGKTWQAYRKERG